jgi:hypothetical protein
MGRGECAGPYFGGLREGRWDGVSCWGVFFVVSGVGGGVARVSSRFECFYAS